VLEQLPDSPAAIVVALILALFSGGGVGALIEAFRNRGKTKAEVTQTVSEAAAGVVEMLQKTANEAQADANEARNAARLAREEAEEARRQMRAMRMDAETLAYRFRFLINAILDDNVTRDHLKELARTPWNLDGGAE